MPDIFQRPLFVLAEPPFAEPYLQQESTYSDEQAQRISAVGGKVQPEGEIDESPDDGLGDVVRQTHLAVEAQVADRLAELLALIERDEGGNQYEGEGKFLPHIERCSRTLLDDGVILHNEFLQRIEWKRCNGGDNQYFYLEARILFRGDEQLLSADVEA